MNCNHGLSHDCHKQAVERMAVKSSRPNGLPLLGSNQDSPDPESDASPRLAGTASGDRVENAQIRAGSPTISPTIGTRTKPFATVRRDVWLRSLPNRAPKDSLRYQTWLAANREAQEDVRRQPVPPRPCKCCEVPFTPRTRNTLYRPECQAAKAIARKRTARQQARTRRVA
jgi:hypothetical protein